MTCIVGHSDGRRVWMGGDRCVTDTELDATYEYGPKVWTVDGFAIGVCGGLNALQRIRALFQPPVAPDVPTVNWCVRDVVPRLIDALDGSGTDSQFMIGVNGALFTVDGDMCVMAVDYECSIGSGSKAALGALYATARRSPNGRIGMALEAAESCCLSVRKPFDLVCV